MCMKEEAETILALTLDLADRKQGTVYKCGEGGSGLLPGQLREYLSRQFPSDETMVPVPVFHGTDRNVLEIEQEDIPMFRDNLWFAAKELYHMLRESPWKYSAVLYPHEKDSWDLLGRYTDLDQEDLREVMEWIMPELLAHGGAETPALYVSSLDDALVYAPMASHFGIIGHCAHTLATAARTLFDASTFTPELKKALAFVDVFDATESRPVVLMFCKLARSSMVHADGRAVEPCEYLEPMTKKECDWKYTKPLSLSDGVELKITQSDLEEFRQVLAEFFGEPDVPGA